MSEHLRFHSINDYSRATQFAVNFFFPLIKTNLYTKGIKLFKCVMEKEFTSLSLVLLKYITEIYFTEASARPDSIYI